MQIVFVVFYFLIHYKSHNTSLLCLNDQLHLKWSIENTLSSWLTNGSRIRNSCGCEQIAHLLDMVTAVLWCHHCTVWRCPAVPHSKGIAVFLCVHMHVYVCACVCLGFSYALNCVFVSVLYKTHFVRLPNESRLQTFSKSRTPLEAGDSLIKITLHSCPPSHYFWEFCHIL